MDLISLKFAAFGASKTYDLEKQALVVKASFLYLKILNLASSAIGTISCRRFRCESLLTLDGTVVRLLFHIFFCVYFENQFCSVSETSVTKQIDV